MIKIQKNCNVNELNKLTITYKKAATRWLVKRVVTPQRISKFVNHHSIESKIALNL